MVYKTVSPLAAARKNRRAKVPTSVRTTNQFFSIDEYEYKYESGQIQGILKRNFTDEGILLMVRTLC